jgi:hypothetical protein
MLADVHPHGHELGHVFVPVRRGVTLAVRVGGKRPPVQRIELHARSDFDNALPH